MTHMQSLRSPNRRIVIATGLANAVLLAVAGCTTTGSNPTATTSGFFGATTIEEPRGPYPAFARQVVAYPSHEPPGTIVVDPGSHYL
jgi:lipoprotein-anchoring transpeptidase ErfK/SrfK